MLIKTNIIKLLPFIHFKYLCYGICKILYHGWYNILILIIIIHIILTSTQLILYLISNKIFM